VKIKKIKRISYLGLENCRDLTIILNHTFLLSSGIVSHNSQYLRGVGVLRNIVLPNYEHCKRPSCRACAEYKKCKLLRGQYERKKEEAFNELLAYTQFRLSQIPVDKILSGSGSPYGLSQKIGMDKEEYGENVVDEDISDIDEK
jgi:hypothetical protein